MAGGRGIFLGSSVLTVLKAIFGCLVSSDISLIVHNLGTLSFVELITLLQVEQWPMQVIHLDARRKGRCLLSAVMGTQVSSVVWT